MSKKTKDIINKEVTRLFNISDKSRYNDAFTELRHKYKDEDLVNEIQKVFMHRYKSLKKRAHKFADLFRKRYGSVEMPYHELLNKARSYAKRHDITDDEFAEFQRRYEQELAGTEKHEASVIPMTKLMKVLGEITVKEQDMEVSESDYKNLQEILKEYEMSKSFHAQTLLQALQYQDVALQARTAIIDRTKHNPNEYIHPIIVAMFLPKIHLFESHFLFSNIGGIVNLRYNKKPLATKPDYELFHSLVTDPNDVVCDNHSPMGDLLSRYRIQHHLWNSVIHLRNGQVYNPIFNEFTKMIDNCRLNKYDNPDFTYGRHDGTVLKRLLAAFSFRPTVVATLPVMNVFSTNPYAQNTRAVITAIPMINIKLHAYQNVNRNPNAGARVGGVGFNRILAPMQVALSSALIQPQTFIENNVLVQRISDVVYSREVLIFYVDRRSHLLQFGSPFNIAKLPTAIAGFERISTYEVEIECSITIRPQNPDNDKFCLRSVVVAEISDPIPNSTDTRGIVIGSSAFIFDYLPDANGDKSCNNMPALGNLFNNTNLGGNQNNCNNAISIYHYDPANALTKHAPYAIYDVIAGVAGGTGMSTWNAAGLPGLVNIGNPGVAGGIPVNGLSQALAEERIRKQGIIFIYQNFNYKKDKEAQIAI